jgi:TatA/E family protein of Tat protein translocase
MFGIGWSETLCLLLIVLLFIGAERLPEIGRSLGEAIREIRSLKRKKRS